MARQLSLDGFAVPASVSEAARKLRLERDSQAGRDLANWRWHKSA